MHVTISVPIIQLEVSAALMQVTVLSSNTWVAIFIVVMQIGVTVAILQVVLSAVHVGGNFYCSYADRSHCCNYAGGAFYCKMQVTVSVIAM